MNLVRPVLLMDLARVSVPTDVQRSINVVSGIRKRFTDMHELGHLELVYGEAPSEVHVAFPPGALAQRPGRIGRPFAVNRPVCSTPPTDEAFPFSVSDFIQENGFSPFILGIAFRQWLLARSSAAQPEPAPQSLIERLIQLRASRMLRVRLGNGALVADDWQTYVSLMDNLLARLHLERALQLAASRRPGMPNIVLVLLAVCRRYGRRSEPDDHSLPRRRQPTFRGVACTVS